MTENKDDGERDTLHGGLIAVGGMVFVGRETELAALRSALLESLAGKGHLATLTGESGIGKTRLAERIADEAVARGARVYWGHCWEDGGAPPYWPWVEILRGCALGDSAVSLPPKSDPAATLLAKLLPAVSGESSRLPQGFESSGVVNLPSSQAESNDHSRFQVFDYVNNLLRKCTTDRPLVLVLDDLHAADLDSLLLLKFIARQLQSTPILILATYREPDAQQSTPLTELLTAIARHGLRIKLGGLAEHEVAAFVEATAGRPLDATVVSSLFQTTQGNPFFLDELFRLVLSEYGGALPAIGQGSFKLPAGIISAVCRRAAVITPEARQVLDAAATIGRNFTATLLQQATRMNRENLLDALHLASRHALVEPVADQPGLFRFIHPIVPQALRSELPQAELQRWHYRIGCAVEEIYVGDADSHLGELAHHFLAALPLGPREKAINYASRAAEQAVSNIAFQEAMRLYEAALSAAETGPGANATTKAELALGLAAARAKAGLVAGAEKSYLKAAALARSAGNPALLVRAALGLGRWLRPPGASNPVLADLLREALVTCGERVSADRAALLGRLAVERYWCGYRDEAGRLSRQGLEIARAAGDPTTLVGVLWARNVALWGPDNTEERLATASEMLRMAEEAHRADWMLRGHDLRLGCFLELGDIRDADLEIEAFAKLTERIGEPLGHVQKFRAMRVMLSGDLAEAERLAEDALSIAESRGLPDAVTSYGAQLSLIRFFQGRLAELEPVLRGFVSQFPSLSVARCGLAHACIEAERLAEAEVELDILAADNFAGIPKDWNWLSSMSIISAVSAKLGDRDRASTLSSLLRPYAGRNAMLGWEEACYGPVSYYLGLLNTCLRQFDRAASDFETALRMNARMGARSWTAQTYMEYATMLAERCERGDDSRAAELINLALGLAGPLGMAGIVARGKRLLERMTGTTRVAPTQKDAGTSGASLFRREGDFWTISHGGQLARVRNLKGFEYIAFLLQNPDTEIHSADLAAGGAARVIDKQPGVAGKTVDSLAGGLSQEGMHQVSHDDAGEMLDPTAKAAYRRRLEELRENLGDARETGNEERIAEIEDEMDALGRELARAVGLHGRDRRAASQAERSRLNVTRAIKIAIDHLTDRDATLGRLLSRSIRTGTFCSYMPDPKNPIPWKF